MIITKKQCSLNLSSLLSSPPQPMQFLSKLKKLVVVMLPHASYLNMLHIMPITETTVTTMTFFVTDMPKLLLVVLNTIPLRPKRLILMREMKNTIKTLLMPTVVVIV